MPEPRVIRTFTAEVVETVAEGFDFTGCTDQNPDYCNCGSWEPAKCRVCGQEIVDGQLIQQIMYPANPHFDMDSLDQEWEQDQWHVVCPEDEVDEDGEPNE